MGVSQSKKNFFWNLIGTGLNCITTFVLIVLITRINGVDTSGVFSVCLSLSLIMFSFSNLGTRVYEVSDLKRDDNIYFALKAFTGILTIAIGMLICVLMKYGRIKTTIIFMLLLVRVIESYSDSVYAVFQKNERLDLAGISYSVKTVFSITVFLIVDIITKNVLFATAFFFLAVFATFLAFDIPLLYRYKKISFKTNGVISLTKDISFFVIFNLIVIVIANIPRLMADTVFSAAQMGYLSIIMMIPTVMSLMGQFIIQPSLTAFVNDRKNKNYTSFKKRTISIIAIIILLTVVFCAATYFLGPPVLSIVMGIDLSKYAFVMTIAIIAGSFVILTTFISTLLTVMEKTRIQLVLYAVSLIVEFLAIYLSLGKEDIFYLFLSFLFSMAIQFFLFLMYYILSIKKEQ